MSEREQRWFEDAGEVLAFAHVLVDRGEFSEGDVLAALAALLYYFEKTLEVDGGARGVGPRRKEDGRVVRGRISRHDLCTWLCRNGFTEKKNLGTGHWHFVHEATGVKVVVPGHGDKELAPKTLSNIVRVLENVGFDRRQLRKDLEA